MTITTIIAALVAVIVGFALGFLARRIIAEGKIGGAEEKARQIIEEGKKTAETITFSISAKGCCQTENQ